MSRTRNNDDRALVDKAFALLRSIHDAGDHKRGVSALARATDLPKATAYRLLVALERNGAVDKVDTTYRLGVGLRQLATDAEAEALSDARTILTPFLVDLAAATGGTVHLATLSGDRVLYLQKIHGHGAPTTLARIGVSAHAHVTATGKVLLAHEPEATDRICRAPLRAHTERSHTAVADVRHDVLRALQTGVGVELGESVPGLACTAVALGGGGRPRVAISVATRDAESVPRHADMLRRVKIAAEHRLRRAGAAHAVPRLASAAGRVTA